MDAVDELIKLYRDHSTQEIEADGSLLLKHFQVAGPDNLLALEGYPDAFALVSERAVVVDKLAAKYTDPDDQVRESVRLLRQMLDEGDLQKKVNATRKLVEGRLYKAWGSDKKALYDEKKKILEWRDFFVSYTNRDAPATNAQFRPLIKSCLGQAPKGEQQQSNYLARVITRHLRRYQGLAGFFDEDTLKVGENIQEEVDTYCARAFALVQLIEPLAFDKEPPRNWCFHEYSQFSKNPEIVAILGDKARHFFILTEADFEGLRPANLFPDFTAWVDRIGTLKQAHISLHKERNTTLRIKIKAIAQQILTLRAEIVDAWLKA